MRLTQADHDRVTAAVTQAETATTGEIVTIVSQRSDAYHDVSLHYAVLTLLATLAGLAAWPVVLEHIYARLIDPWAQVVPPGAMLAIALVLVTLVFLATRLVLAVTPVRIALTPGATKSRRVRRRALMLFRAGAEKRTRGATGVLLYLSLAEHRAELVADAPIHSRVAPEVWGEAMAVLIAAVKDDRPGDGMAAAIERIGAVLAEHFPRDANDLNELPDRVIEL